MMLTQFGAVLVLIAGLCVCVGMAVKSKPKRSLPLKPQSQRWEFEHPTRSKLIRTLEALPDKAWHRASERWVGVDHNDGYVYIAKFRRLVVAGLGNDFEFVCLEEAARYQALYNKFDKLLPPSEASPPESERRIREFLGKGSEG